jgi:peroxiredoxin
MTPVYQRLAGSAILAAVVAASGFLIPALADVQVGKPAPDFTAIDSDGKSHQLSGLKGKIVVLEWTNHGCPYVGKHYGTGNMQALQKEATDSGVVWLSVVSSPPGMQGYVSGLEANKLTTDRKARPSAVLLDPEGTVGRLYEAKATPHMFVIDKQGMVAYAGAIDDKPTANHADVNGARNYVREAVAAVAAGKAMSPAATRAYGCGIKLAPPPKS